MQTVLGMGNALVDALIRINDDSLLAGFGLEKGSMTLVDKEKSQKILEATASLEKQRSSGGSAANSIHGMAKLGTPCGYIGKTGSDDYGSFFLSYMTHSNICTKVFAGTEETGKCIALISEDSERTFATFLGAAVELAASDLTLDPFKGYDYFLLEGYLVQNYALVERAIKLAKEAGCRIAIDLASFNIVKQNLDFLRAIVEKHIDIVFANEEESRAFTGKENPAEALEDISTICETSVVKIGRHGSLIKEGSRRYEIAPIKAKCVDTTGAGDLYASGFFYGLTHGQTLDICGKIGSITSGKVVEVIGTKMDDRKWSETIEMIRVIV